MKKGFTLIELLVASVLLGMLATILTMIFNQSSIAWRTGVSSVANLGNSRAALGTFHDIRDELLPGLGDRNPSTGVADTRTVRYRTVSLWDKGQPNRLRGRNQRAFNFDNPAITWGKARAFGMNDAQTAAANDPLSGSDTRNPNEKRNYSVGVRSLGPDGKPDTADDISTWPEEID